MLKRGLHFLRQYFLEGVLLLLVGIFIFVQQLEVLYVVNVLLGYVLIVLLLNKTFLYKGIRKGLRDIKKERWYWLIILITATLLFIWQFSLEAIIFLTLFLAFSFYGWNSRIIATGALISLASCPVLLIVKQDAYAEQMAVYTYYFLIITVVLQIVEYKKHPEKFKDDNE